MPRAAKQIDKEDPEYLEKRAKNNEAIKKSREKARAKVLLSVLFLHYSLLSMLKNYIEVFTLSGNCEEPYIVSLSQPRSEEIIFRLKTHRQK